MRSAPFKIGDRVTYPGPAFKEDGHDWTRIGDVGVDAMAGEAMTFMEEDRDLDYLKDEADWDSRLAGFCPDCHFAWSVHSSAEVSWVRPFGCPPSETAARERWGR